MSQPIDPIPYRSTHISPPLVIPLLGFVSIIIACCTFALSAFLATKTYYATPAAPTISSARPIWRPPQRVTLEQGNAIVNGVGNAMNLDAASRERLAKLLVRLKDDVSFELDEPPSAEKIAARKTEEGKLFGEEGAYAVIGQVRIEFTPKRIKLTIHPGGVGYVEESENSFTRSNLNQNIFSFLSPPPPAPPKPIPRPIAQLAPLLLAYSDAAVSALLAILLLAAAIHLLHYRRTGRNLHLTWCWIKLPLSIAAAGFGFALGARLHLNNGISVFAGDVVAHPGFTASVLCALYAIITLIILFLPSVRAHFGAYDPAK